MHRFNVILWALLTVIPLSAVEGNEILKKLDRNLSPESYESAENTVKPSKARSGS